MIYSIALTMFPGITLTMQLEMLRHGYRAEDIIMRPEETLKEMNANCRIDIIKTILARREQVMKTAKEEMDFCERHQIQVLPYGEKGYPTRLLDCPDAPAILYYRGTANLDAKHILAVVGTRKITEYGKQVCTRLTERLAEILPDTLVISGLAYGVDIHAHRGCIDHGLATVGVVAHGLDQIYPACHRNDAKRMLSNGGILTEYPRGTRPLQGNFLRRNRIVAGMADATIVVESAEHGGSLVTARIANSYQRQVYAFPGRINDPCSVGCNNLILKMKATMALCADDIVVDQGWWPDSVPYKAEPHQLDLFEVHETMRQKGASMLPSLPPVQQKLAELLQGTDGLNLIQLAEQTGMTQSELSPELFDMELSGVIKVLPGGLYLLTK